MTTVADGHVARKKALDFSRADERAFFRRIFGKAEGFVAVSRGMRPAVVDQMIKWPDDADELLSVDGSKGAFFRPVLRETDVLSVKGGLMGSTPTLAWSLWVDLDKPFTDAIRAETQSLGGLIVWSGRPGHCHIYVPLAEAVDVPTAEDWNFALKERWGGDDKWRDDGLWLRLPGSTHWSGATVTIEPIASNRRATQASLEALCGPVEPRDRSRASSRSSAPIERVQVELKRLPAAIGTAFRKVDGDQSDRFYELVCACKEAGWSKGQTADLIDQFPATPERYVIDGRVDAQIHACWAKHEAKHPTPSGRDGRLRLTPASAIEPRPVRWAWDERIPVGSLSLAVGNAGVGKSQFASWLAAQVTTGRLQGAFRGTPRGVIYAAAEDSWAMTLVPRLMAAGADLNGVFRVEVEEVADGLVLPRDTEDLGEVILDHGVGLVVCDPLLSLMTGVDDYRGREVRSSLEPLVRIADETGAVILGLAHFTKTGTDPLTMVSGSSAFGQLARAALAFARDEDNGSWVLSQIKNNLGRLDLPNLEYEIQAFTVGTNAGDAEVSRFHFTGYEASRSVRDIIVKAGGASTVALKRDEAAAWLEAFLRERDGEATRQSVVEAGEAEGHTLPTLKRAARKLGVQPSRKGFAGGSVWSLPD